MTESQFDGGQNFEIQQLDTTSTTQRWLRRQQTRVMEASPFITTALGTAGSISAVLGEIFVQRNYLQAFEHATVFGPWIYHSYQNARNVLHVRRSVKNNNEK